MSVPLFPSKAQRLTALKALRDGLSGRTRPDGPAALREQLADLGDLLRRRRALSLDGDGVQARFAALPVDEVRRAADSVDVDAVSASLKNAIEESIALSFSDEPDEQEQWRTSVATALLNRDRLQSRHRALEVLAVGNDGLIECAEAIEASLRRVDQGLSSQARGLVSLNEFRRIERDLLDPAEQKPAWWFTARADCDPFLRALAGEVENPHTPKCEECKADLAKTELVLRPPPVHLSSSIALELDLGLLPPPLESRYRKHAERCPACRAVLEAIADGDDAIEEFERQPPPPPAQAARRRDEQVLEDGRQFKVVLRRRESSFRLLVVPRQGATLASASLTVSSRRNPVAPHPTADGLEFDLGAQPLEGSKLTLRIKLGGEAAPIERSFTL